MRHMTAKAPGVLRKVLEGQQSSQARDGCAGEGYGNSIPSQHCGVPVTAELTIRNGHRRIYTGTLKGHGDYTFKSDVVTEISITANSPTPQVKKVAGTEFYK
jgi:hypothetical protein